VNWTDSHWIETARLRNAADEVMAATTPLSAVALSLVQAAALSLVQAAHPVPLLVRPDDPTPVAAVVVHPRAVARKLKQPSRNQASRAESMRHLDA
jgi:hypothetical protein